MVTLGSIKTGYVLSSATNDTTKRLLNQYRGQLFRLAKRQKIDKASIGIEDLVSVGLIGLLEAASTYDKQKNPDFWLYAHPRVRGAMIDEIRSTRYFGRRVGLDYSFEEFSFELHGSACYMPPVEFGKRTTWVNGIECLGARNRQIVSLYFIRGLALHRIGRLFDITESRAAQICSKSLTKLRSTA